MWKLKIISVVAVAGLLAVGVLLSLSLTGCGNTNNQTDPTNNTGDSEVMIPAIDADAPAETETATFALG